MHFERQIAGLLHDEHVETIAVLEQFESVLHARRKESAPDVSNDPELAQIMRRLRNMAESDLPTHFAFEEVELFPRLAEFGDGAMGELLAEEHKALTATINGLAEIGTRALDHGMDAGDWETFKRLGNDFLETMTGHIQKEEMGLLAALEAMLDGDGDRQLAEAYMAVR